MSTFLYICSVIIGALSTTMVAHAVQQGGEVFLQGNYIEVGIHQAGSYGTEGVAPPGFHPLGVPQLGFVADFQKDGWSNGFPRQSGDYFLPGSPEEGWAVQWSLGGVKRNRGNFGRMGVFQVPKSNLVETSAGDVRSAVWEGEAVNGLESLKIKQTTQFNKDDLFFVNRIVLTNTGIVPLDSVEYMRNVDPDQEQPLTGNFTTSNFVVNSDTSKLVMAKGLDYGITLGLGTIDGRGVVSTEGFSNRNPDDILDSPVTPPRSNPIVADQAIALAYRFGTLTPGQSVSFDYVYLFNEADLLVALGNLTGQTLSINNLSLIEGNNGTIANAVFTVTRSFDGGQPVTVNYSTANGTAKEPADYTAASGTLTFGAGELSKTIIVPVKGDNLNEDVEDFYVNLSNPVNATLINTQGVGTIIDDDPQPTLLVNDVTVNEGNSGITNANFTVSLSAPSGKTVQVDVASADDTATALDDYAPLPKTTLTFAPGETTKTLAIQVKGDTTYEDDEQFFLNFSNPSNATIDRAKGIGTIANDDPIPQLTIGNTSVTEGNTGTIDATFAVRLSASSSKAISVDYTTADSTAKAPDDYTACAGTLTFAPGETAKSITVPVKGDSLDEINETFLVNLTNPINVILGNAQGIGTILDDDEAPSVAISDATVDEGNTGTTNAAFNVTLSKASGQIITIDYATADGTATALDDYTATAGTLTFAPGEISKTIGVLVKGDTQYEKDETFFVNLTNPVPSRVQISTTRGTGTIRNDDVLPYRATVQTNVHSANIGTPIPLTGSAISLANGSLVPSAPVSIRILVNGSRRLINVTTDANGQFQTVFHPLPAEAGHYSLAAAHPVIDEDLVQDQFQIVGMTADPAQLNLNLIPGTPLSGEIAVSNLSDIPLTGITAIVQGAPANIEVQLTAAQSLAASGTLNLHYSVKATGTKQQDNQITMRLTSAEGAVLNVAASLHVQPPVPKVIASVGSLTSGMLRGAQTPVAFDITNMGGAASGNLQVLLPDAPWLSLASSATIPSLAPGDKATITLNLTPAATLPLGPYKGSIVITGTGTNISVPFQFTAISDSLGDLHIEAVDEFTYYVDGSPKVANATVTITDPTTNDVVCNGVTDANGELLWHGLREGYYNIRVQADKHSDYNATILIAAGQVNEVTAFLPRQLVSYNWTVKPTDIPDEYTFELQTTFETNVPVPVVTVDPPTVDLDKLTAETTQVNFTLTNHGLIAAQGVKLHFDKNPLFEITPLSGNVDDLAAQSSVVVPVIFHRLTPAPSASLKASRTVTLVRQSAAGGKALPARKPASISRTIPGHRNSIVGTRSDPITNTIVCATIGAGVLYHYLCGPSDRFYDIPIVLRNAASDACLTDPSPPSPTPIGEPGPLTDPNPTEPPQKGDTPDIPFVQVPDVNLSVTCVNGVIHIGPLYSVPGNPPGMIKPVGLTCGMDNTLSMIVHGWNGSIDFNTDGPDRCSKPWTKAIQEAESKDVGRCVEGYDWREAASPTVTMVEELNLAIDGKFPFNLYKTFNNAKLQGETLAELLKKRIERGELKAKNIRFIGHSFGGVVSGIAARRINAEYGPVGEIILIDTPQLGTFLPATAEVDPNTATRVINIYGSLHAGAVGGPLSNATNNVTNVGMDLGTRYLSGDRCPDVLGLPLGHSELPGLWTSVEARIRQLPSGDYYEQYDPRNKTSAFYPGKPSYDPEQVRYQVPYTHLSTDLSLKDLDAWYGQNVTQELRLFQTSIRLAERAVTANKLKKVRSKKIQPKNLTAETTTSNLSDASAQLYREATIPARAKYMRFQYLVENVGDGDKLALSFGDQLLYESPLSSTSGRYVTSNPIFVGHIAGATGQFTITLKATGLPKAVVYLSKLEFLDVGGSNQSDNLPSDGVCAKVRLHLQQNTVISRSAFQATLELNNAAAANIEQIKVKLNISDADRQAADAVFGVRDPQLTGITKVDGTGVLAAETTGRAVWTIIPSHDAAPNGPQRYFVGGELSYVQDGHQITIPLFPESIQVLPDPSLDVNYFHQRDVYSDDPFTDEVEPAEPFALGMMMTNHGQGSARNVTITSAQPEIIDNEKGLLVNFKIIGTQVGAQQVTPSLKANLGTIDPGKTAVAQWLMTSSLSGKFTDYQATFKHIDGLGDARFSLIDSIKVHELVHSVRADVPNDDGVPDFLVNDVADAAGLPDTLYRSDGVVLPVAAVTEVAVDNAPAPGTLAVHLTATMPPGWAYLQIPDPGQDQYRLKKVVRSDGREILLDYNAWATHRIKRLVGQDPTREDSLHLLDFNSTGSYTLYYESALPGLTVNEVQVKEGDKGTTNANFTVSLSAPSYKTVTVNYATADGTAKAPDDYTAIPTGTLTFAPGEISKPVSVVVKGDTLNEGDETFQVNLSNPSNATLTKAQGTGTIIDDDDAPSISINSIKVNEGDTGTTNALFTVSLSAASGKTVKVDVATADGTATAPSDYTALPATTLTFAPGETSKTVTVKVNGDTLVEPDETFKVNLTNPSNATLATGATSQGVGTIVNDDGCNPAADITGAIKITRYGYRLNTTTKRYVQSVMLQNLGTRSISGPLTFVLDSLSSNAKLYNLDGTTSCSEPAGSPYLNVPLGATGVLPSGSSVTLTLEFTNPTNAAITYLPRILGGPGTR